MKGLSGKEGDKEAIDVCERKAGKACLKRSFLKRRGEIPSIGKIKTITRVWNE